MAGGLSLKPARAAGARGWLALTAILAGGAVLAWALPATLLDWQPDRVAAEPWRAWTAAFVHWSPWHLAANLAGLAVVATLGRVAGLAAPAALAWFVAWPLTQIGLLLRPELAHYGGLSGVLHAGVAVAACALLAAPQGRPPVRRARRIGLGLLAGLALKLALEEPWGPALRRPADWDIAVAPLAHATGTLAGLACAALAAVFARVRPRRRAA